MRVRFQIFPAFPRIIFSRRKLEESALNITALWPFRIIRAFHGSRRKKENRWESVRFFFCLPISLAFPRSPTSVDILLYQMLLCICASVEDLDKEMTEWRMKNAFLARSQPPHGRMISERSKDQRKMARVIFSKRGRAPKHRGFPPEVRSGSPTFLVPRLSEADGRLTA